MPDVDLGALLGSWELTLRSERKSAQTVKSYGDDVRRFPAWCDAAALPRCSTARLPPPSSRT